MEILNTKGGNKRNASSGVEEAVAEDGTPDETITTKREKKAKKDKLEEDDHNDASLSDDNPPFANRMEKRKKRKALDKERRHSHNDGSQVVGSQVVEIPRARNSSEGHVASQSPLSSAGLPDIHVAVFSDLSSADSLVREAAAETLVKELQEVQKAHEKLRDKGVDEGGLQLEAEKDDGLNNCASSLRYAIRRLIRGVSSSRECARQGFALGLTLVVGTIPAVNVESVMKLITDILEVTSSMKGQEARDCLLGRLFAYGALARSGRIVQECISDNYTSCVKEFVGHVVSLASKKLYLREPAVWVILDLVEKLPVDALVGHVLEAPGMQEWFESAADVGNPDALLLALKMREKISTDNKTLSKLLPCPFSPNKLFTVDHLSSLISCFKESTFCQPRVHTVWPVLVNILMPDLARLDEDVCLSSNLNKKHKKSRKCNSSKEDNEKNLRFFCDVVIEGCLLSSSHDRKHLAFDVLMLLLPRLPASCVHVILSEKLVHCLMDILSTNDSWLYKVAQYFLRELSNWIGNDDDRRVAVIIALQKHSCGRFDCITRTHTVKGLVAELNTGSGCMLFIQNLMGMFLDGGQVADEPSDQSQTTDENSEHGSLEDKDSVGTLGNLDFLKNWVIESLPRILKNLRTDVEARIRVQKEIIKFLAVQGLFSASLGTEVTSFELQEKFKWPKAATSSTICRMCIEQLQLLLADAQKGEASWSSFHPHEMNDLGLYFMRFLGTLCNIPSVSIFRPLSNEDEKAFKSLQDMEARLSREERNHGPGITANKVRALRYLLIQLLLQVLLRPGEFSEAASELVLCCKKAFPFLIDPEEEEEFDNNEMPELIDVLVDTLLSLLPQSSSPTCFSVEQVFRFFCDDITDTGLLRMLRVIKKDLKPARHQATQSDDDDDDEDFLGIEEAEEEIEEADAADTGDSDGHADGSEGLPEIETTGGELPASDDSDGGMDDDAMFRMDSYLARIFKERKNSTGSETAQFQLVLFKLRVLSLIEIYLHRNPGKVQVLTVYLYLAQAFVNSHTAEGSDQVGQRIVGILQKKIFKAKEYPRGEEIHLSTLESMIEKGLKSASRSRHKMVTSLAQNSVFWILKIVLARNFPPPKLKRVLEIFQHAMVDYFDSKKCRLKSGFIKEVFHRHSWIAQQLFGFLLEKCGNAKSEYRRVEALVLVDCILKSCMPTRGAGGDNDNSAAHQFFKAHLSLICDLIQQLLIKLPEKQSRRAEVRRFCARTLQAVSMLKLNKPFIKALKPEAYTACESQLGDLFLPFKRPAK